MFFEDMRTEEQVILKDKRTEERVFIKTREHENMRFGWALPNTRCLRYL